jgi:hypothetical protein
VPFDGLTQLDATLSFDAPTVTAGQSLGFTLTLENTTDAVILADNYDIGPQPILVVMTWDQSGDGTFVGVDPHLTVVSCPPYDDRFAVPPHWKQTVRGSFDTSTFLGATKPVVVAVEVDDSFKGDPAYALRGGRGSFTVEPAP